MGVSYGTVNVNDEYEEWNSADNALTNYTYVLADDSSAESLFFGYNSDYLGSNILLGAEFSVELRDLDKTVYDLLSGSISTAFEKEQVRLVNVVDSKNWLFLDSKFIIVCFIGLYIN